MHLPSRPFIAIAAVIVFLLASCANGVVSQIESPAAGLTAKSGPPLPVPRQATLPSAETTRSFNVVTHVASNGDVRVQETIVQDFGVVSRHGIERIIPLRDDLGEHTLDHLVVSTSDGTPDGVSINAQADSATIRIGDADTLINGAHTYRLTYDLGGVVEGISRGRSLLALDALSTWQQPIDSLRYTVIGPQPPTTLRCEQGPVKSTDPCASARRTKNGATFTGSDIRFEEAFTVRLTWPQSVVAPTAGASSFSPENFIYALIAAVAVAFVVWRYRRRWVQLLGTAQTQLWATFGPDVQGQQLEAYDLTGDPAIEFVPPMALRPGEMGALAEVPATTLLTATVIDLAARGVIKITETSGSWTIERRSRDVLVTDDEQAVLAGLLGTADSASLDDRGKEMSTLAGTLAENLTDDLEARGLAVIGTDFGGLNTKAHQAWSLVLGIVAVIIGAVVHVVMVAATGNRTAALAVETLVVVAVVLGFGALRVSAGRTRAHPARTCRGLARARLRPVLHPERGDARPRRRGSGAAAPVHGLRDRVRPRHPVDRCVPGPGHLGLVRLQLADERRVHRVHGRVPVERTRVIVFELRVRRRLQRCGRRLGRRWRRELVGLRPGGATVATCLVATSPDGTSCGGPASPRRRPSSLDERC